MVAEAVTTVTGSTWTVHDWLTLAGIVAGSGGGWRLIDKISRLVTRVEELTAAGHALAKSHEKLVDKVNDHEKRLTRRGM